MLLTALHGYMENCSPWFDKDKPLGTSPLGFIYPCQTSGSNFPCTPVRPSTTYNVSVESLVCTSKNWTFFDGLWLLKFVHEQINYKPMKIHLMSQKNNSLLQFVWMIFSTFVKLTFLPSTTFVWFPVLTMWTPMCPPTVCIWKCNKQQTQDWHSR